MTARGGPEWGIDDPGDAVPATGFSQTFANGPARGPWRPDGRMTMAEKPLRRTTADRDRTAAGTVG